MIKFISISVFIVFIFSGCSAKKINENVESITDDISSVFEGAKDKSKD